MPAGSIRARVRAEMIAEIKTIARRHLETDGANLSLRAVARDMGMVSSALYRYFASRDDLLTALIMDAYNAIGEAVETAEADVRDRSQVRGRPGDPRLGAGAPGRVRAAVRQPGSGVRGAGRHNHRGGPDADSADPHPRRRVRVGRAEARPPRPARRPPGCPDDRSGPG